MAKVPNGVETLPKISIVGVGCTNVTDRQTDRRQTTDDRQTDGRTSTYSEHEHEFTFAKTDKIMLYEPMNQDSFESNAHSQNIHGNVMGIWFTMVLAMISSQVKVVYYNLPK